ncbi:fibronectin type III domain-containing protein [Actinoplanes sp. TBRC 11911]|uniref:fibronectin type III domain-containing protein n=1 Tax=Actinoplanes sp. TBRC 11911 TaxID=2729386 RepID=UPI00145D67B1|nr:fibronectin type III domain-containing protein [Actinoplanes sp. TBRC 11911]NMO53370.1 fibronectin type III domain-containing protein [Actinoplanes sp. TBRC 11911]
MRRLRTLSVLLAAGTTLLAAAGCTHGTAATTSPAVAAATAAPLPKAWTVQPAPAVTVPAAQVAPGAWAPSPTPTWGFLKTGKPVPVVSRSVPATSPVCPATLGPAPNLPVTATAGTGSVTVSWPGLGDRRVQAYRVGAVPQGWSKGPGTTGSLVQAPGRWHTVTAVHTCATVTYRFTGLTRGTAYEFWLDAVHTTDSYGAPTATQETMIGRSSPVVVH